MADQEINLNFNADSAEEAASKVNELTDSLNENADAASASASSASRSSNSMMQGATATNANASATVGLTGKIKAMTMAAGPYIAVAVAIAAAVSKGSEEYTRQMGIMNNFRGSIEETSDRINGLISNIDLMQASAVASAAGLQLTDHELGNIAVAAQQYSERTGEDLNESFNQLTEALNSGSTEAMNRFGISTGGATDKATGQRNAIADLNAQYGTMDASVNGLGGRMDAMSGSLANANTEFIAGLDASEDMHRAFQNLDEEFAKLMEAFGAEAGPDGGFGIVQFAVDTVSFAVETMTRQIGTFISGLRQIKEGNFAAGIWDVATAFTAAGRAAAVRDTAVARQERIRNRASGEAGEAAADASLESLAAAQAAQAARDLALNPEITGPSPGTVAAAARGGGGGGGESRAARAAREAAEQATRDSEELASAILEEEEARVEANAAAAEGLRLSNLRIDAAIAELNLAERLVEQTRIQVAEDRIAAEARLRIAREYEESSERARERESQFRQAQEIGVGAMQDTINQSAQTIFNAEEQRQQRKTDLQNQYNQAVADGDAQKAAATKAEMKALGGAGKAIKEAMKAQLKSFAIQTGFKAIAAGAEALGLAAVGNFPGAALKGTEAAELAAVAALAGGAAAAIPKGKSGGGGAEAKPSGGSGSTGPGSTGNVQAAPIIVNIVGQTYVTQAQVGEAIIQATNAAKARY